MTFHWGHLKGFATDISFFGYTPSPSLFILLGGKDGWVESLLFKWALARLPTWIRRRQRYLEPASYGEKLPNLGQVFRDSISPDS